MTEDYRSIDVAKLTKEIFKKWWLILLCIVIFSGVAYAFTRTVITPVYRATSTIFIGRDSGRLTELSLADITLGQKLVSDYHELIRSNLVIEEVIRNLPSEFRNINTAYIRANLSVQVIVDSRFMRVFFDDVNPERARAVVNKISEILTVKAEEIVGAKNVQIIDYAMLPNYPVRPNLFNNVSIAGLLGLIFAVLIILLKMQFSDTVKTQEDIESELGLPVLGVIPKFKGDDVK